jgi:hypothetical protein
MNAEKTLMVAVAVLGMSQAGWALPMLQLDIINPPGNYIGDTTYATSDTFDLLALLNTAHPQYHADLPAGTFYFDQQGNKKWVGTLAQENEFFVSVAITPKIGGLNGDFGSFSVNGQSYSYNEANVGTPLASTIWYDPALANHDNLFPTYNIQVPIVFNGQTPAYDVQTEETVSGFLKTAELAIDVSQMINGYDIHFDLYDLYTATLAVDYFKKVGGKWVLKDEVDFAEYQAIVAPFSHDAQSVTITNTPDGGTTITLLGMAMVGLTMVPRRNRK